MLLDWVVIFLILALVAAAFGFGGFAAPTNSATSGTYLYCAFTTGTLAESLSTDGVASAFLKSMGWSPTW